MKIDIHAHTKKCKSGDAPTREISPADCCEAILSSEVRIIAITNHNVFDIDQYTEIYDGLNQGAQVWPGVELDIMENGSKGHLLVIVSPTLATQFHQAVYEITKDSTPDNFKATIDEVLERFDLLNPLYIAHYRQKKPNIANDALEKLIAKTNNPNRVIKEVTNAISAGIYISHGHASIYGSDVHDWSTYASLSRELPNLRLPVDSFEHFCLLLEKDPVTINTLLDRKISENLILYPFEDRTELNIKVYNDINIIFGPKGTGKSCILKAIANHYTNNGIIAKVYESASDRLGEIFDTKGKDLTINLDNHNINYCSDEIEALRATSEVGVTSLSEYVSYFSAENTNRSARKILIKDIEPEEESGTKREFREFNEAVKTTADFLNFMAQNSSVKKALDDKDHEKVTQILSELLSRLNNSKQASFSSWKEICLLNATIKTFRSEVARKTGTPSKPTTTGFREYAMNRIRTKVNSATIVRNIDTQISIQSENVGSLGSNKGVLEFRTEFKFQSGDITNSLFSSLAGTKKGTQKKFINQVREILDHAYSDELFKCITKLNAIEDVEDIKTVYELLLFRRYFALDDQPYLPSSGEASMVMLQKELGTDKEVYILDEPERSLGNEYINDVIVPLIKERARAGKKVFISTHDANIAVRTLPYSSLYRYHGPEGYRTYIGNPFSNNLINPEDETAMHLDWKMVSMKTLEGGKKAFGERGKIYGNS